MRFMRMTDVRLLVIDELHNLLSGSPGQQRRLLNLLRWLGNELQIPLVAVGTVEALRAVRSDDHWPTASSRSRCLSGTRMKHISVY